MTLPFRSCRIIFSFCMCLSFVFSLGIVRAEEPQKYVSLVLDTCSVKQDKSDVFITLEVSLHNDTEKDIEVVTEYFSVFDGLDLIVTDEKGKTITQVPYIYHQSKFSPGRTLVLKTGVTSEMLRIPFLDGGSLKGAPQKLKVRLVGTLPQSAYKNVISTESIAVEIRK